MVHSTIPRYRRFEGRTPAEIRKGHQIVVPYTENLEAIVTEIDRADEADSVIIGEQTAMPSFWAHKFKKYGPGLRLFSQTPDYQAIASKRNPVVEIPQAMFSAEGAYRGYTWVGNDRGLRVVPLLAAVEGAELLALEADRIKVKRYNQRLGGKVPSRSRPFTHTTTMSGVPFVDLGEKVYSEWTKLRSHNTAESQQWYGEMEQDRKSPVYLFTPHDVAAYHFAAATFRGGDRPAANPFAIPGPRTSDFIEKCRDNVLVSYMAENGKFTHRNLNKTEKEILLWGYTEKFGGECPSNPAWIIDNTGLGIVHAAGYLVRE